MPAETLRPDGIGQRRIDRTLVFVGLMGAGKTCIGRKVAARLGLPFVDADREIELAAGCSIPEIFARHGEAVFRDGERRVIALLLEGSPRVLSTGGGAFMDAQTRARIRERGVSIWLRAELSVLAGRVTRRGDRPLLKDGNPAETLARLIELRYPVYAEADLCIDTRDEPPEYTVERVLAALRGAGILAAPQ